METTDNKVTPIPKKINTPALILTLVLSLAFLIAGIVRVAAAGAPQKLSVGRNTVTLGPKDTEFTFTPARSDTYTFTTFGNYDTTATLYRNKTALFYDDDSGIDLNFSITLRCTGGETYTLKIHSKYACTVELTVFTEEKRYFG
ncbi:MAG TPA: hypothetical protein DDY70_06805 [Clostridiales bacterium]|nr:hypothetical protein [Clostridiales bacterium]